MRDLFRITIGCTATEFISIRVVAPAGSSTSRILHTSDNHQPELINDTLQMDCSEVKVDNQNVNKTATILSPKCVS